MATLTVTAVVASAPVEPGKTNFSYQTLTLKKTQPGPREILVRMVASGICHTDLVIGGAPGTYPKVLGHEGAGYAEAVGSEVSGISVGDPLLLSYSYCASCDACKYDVPTYCKSFFPENILTPETIFSSPDSDDVAGKFFGQSSFASLSIVNEKCVVNVKGLVSHEDMKKFCPLGCGLMTGSGAICNTASAGPRDIVVVAGLGAVGLGAIMTAKIQGCKAIIAVDRLASRLAIAKDVGATHVLDTSNMDINAETYSSDLGKAVQELAPDSKIDIAIDTTGVLPVVNGLIKSLSMRGRLIQIGIPITHVKPSFDLDYADMWGGFKRIEMNLLGDARAQEQVPKMIQWYKEGRFPFDKFTKFYDAKDVNQAIEDMKGEVIKPILLH